MKSRVICLSRSTSDSQLIALCVTSFFGELGEEEEREGEVGGREEGGEREGEGIGDGGEGGKEGGRREGGKEGGRREGLIGVAMGVIQLKRNCSCLDPMYLQTGHILCSVM